MSRSWRDPAALAAIGVTLLCFVGELLAGSPARAWAALITCWLFFAGIAVGVVALQALLALSGGRWADVALRPIPAITGFLPWAGGLLLLILAGRSHWLAYPGDPGTFRAWWLSAGPMAVREIVATTVLFVLAARLARRPAGGARAIVYLVVYGFVLSGWAVDFIVALDQKWISTLAGGHLFVGAWASGVALLALLCQLRGEATKAFRHDMGRLVFVAAVLWGYLAWSQYLPAWYANLPDEVKFLMARGGEWAIVSIIVVALIFLVPFLLMLSPRVRTSGSGFAVASGSMLLGLWLERWLLVAPSERVGREPFTGAEIVMFLGLGAALLLMSRIPSAPEKAEQAGPAGRPAEVGQAK